MRATLLLLALLLAAPAAAENRWAINSPGADGFQTLELRTDRPQPVTVRGGDESLVYRETFQVEFDRRRRIVMADSFLGLDRGDSVEMDVELRTETGTYFYGRSLHWPLHYDAWFPLHAYYIEASAVRVSFSCRVTGTNAGGELSARCHFGVRLLTLPVEAEEPPEPPDPPDPPEPTVCDLDTPRPERLSSCYVSITRRGGDSPTEGGLRWTMHAREQELVWFGERNPWFAAEKCPNDLPGPWNMAAAEMLAYAERGGLLLDGGLEWGKTPAPPYDVRNIKHMVRQLMDDNSRFPGRTSLYKPAWNAYRAELDPHLAAAPGKGVREWCQRILDGGDSVGPPP